MVGGEYSISDLSVNNNNLDCFLNKNIPNISYFSSGRDAIYQLCSKFTNKKIWLPDFLCKSIYEPIRKLDLKIDFYNINDFLNIDIKQLNLNSNDVFFSICYFGKYNKDLYKFLLSKDLIIVSDITHIIYNSEALNNIVKISDYTICSLRKIAPLPDGAFVGSKNNYIEPKNKTRNIFSSLRLGALISRGYSKNINYSNDENFEVLKKAEKILDNSIDYGYAISFVSKELFKTVDILKNKNKTIKNHILLFNRLNVLKDIYIPITQTSYSQYFPIIFHSVKIRDIIRKELFKNKIFCPIHWDTSFIINGNKIYEKMFSIPCDYRYSSEDMEYIIGIIKDAL